MIKRNKMKTINIAKYALFVICIALSVSCAKEKLINKIKNLQKVTFYAYDAESKSTKTTLDGTSILWNPGDELMVYQGTLSSGKFTSTATEASANSNFTGNLPIIIGWQESSPEASNIWAVYPYSAACGCDGSSVNLVVSGVQTAQTGTFASGIFPAIAKSNDYSLPFYNVCGGVKFTVAQEGIKKVVLKGRNSEQLAGKINVSFSNGLPVVNSITESVDSIIVNAPSSEGFVPGDEYFIVAIPTALSNGFSLTYSNDYGATIYASSNSVQIKRKTFGVVSQKDTVGILFSDPVAKAACVEKFDINSDGEVSFSEAATPTTLEGLFAGHEDVQYFPELKRFTSVTDLKGCCNGCANLLEIEIPNFITTLGESSFNGCSSLTEINIPSSVESIGKKAFYGCSSISGIIIPSGVQSIGNEAFRNCTTLKEITIQEGVKTLGGMAFYSIGARMVTLPSTISSIGTKTFWNEVEEIILKGKTPPTRTELSFGTSTFFYVPDDAVTTYKNADVWTYFEDNIFPESGYITNLSLEGTANCYIVNKFGNFSFNAMVKGCSLESVGTPVSASVLWESFGTDVTPNVGDIVRNVSYSSGTVRFSTPATLNNGNAVIAVKDNLGNILWSWHIWVCKDFDPVKTAQVYKNNAGIMMDRNLGATSTTPGNVHTLGLLYQWGRKDPFLSSSDISNSIVSASTIIWPTSVLSDNNNGTIAYSLTHPTTFIAHNSKNYDWYYTGSSSTDNTRWNTEKSIYDPCPQGWRVPDDDYDMIEYARFGGVWTKAFAYNSKFYDGPWNSTNRGMDFGSGNDQLASHQLGLSKTIWYPAAGYRLNEGGSLYDVGNTGYYWSCTQNGYPEYRFFSMSFNKGGDVHPCDYYSHGNAYGQSVRCCKE